MSGDRSSAELTGGSCQFDYQLCQLFILYLTETHRGQRVRRGVCLCPLYTHSEQLFTVVVLWPGSCSCCCTPEECGTQTPAGLSERETSKQRAQTEIRGSAPALAVTVTQINSCPVST